MIVCKTTVMKVTLHNREIKKFKKKLKCELQKKRGVFFNRHLGTCDWT